MSSQRKLIGPFDQTQISSAQYQSEPGERDSEDATDEVHIVEALHGVFMASKSLSGSILTLATSKASHGIAVTKKTSTYAIVRLV
jgi:hypothetical protein